MPPSCIASRCFVWLTMLFLSGFAFADEFERDPINYSQSTPDNCITQLQSQLDRGEARLDFSPEQGYLRSLLTALKVPTESQMLVFSKTSLQRDRISSRRPRALYFNDDVYIGFCQDGEVLEISTADPVLGTVFYILDQTQQEQPKFRRQTESCLICHSSSRTEGVPGHTVRSLFSSASGQPIYSAGSYTIDYTSPFNQRWGSWYVTGKHGTQQHLGNLVIHTKEVVEPVDNAQGQNVVDLSDRFAVEPYLTPHSDIVALLVFEHQTLTHNRITKANYVTRQALHYEAAFNKSLGEPVARRLDSTTRRIQSAGDDLVETLLYAGEPPLVDPVTGTSGFAECFAQAGPRDSQGRSLRDFDLRTRMFKYPCSYLIYSRSFDALPAEMLTYIWQRLWDVLAKDADADKFAHLTAADKQAIVEILRDTKSNLPQYWRE